MDDMTEQVDTLIIGGGQAGLALSELLLQKGRPHLVIEQAAQPAEAWRHHRWDSFTFVTPNWSIKMPGGAYDGPDPDGFMSRDEIVAYFEEYIKRHNLPIRYNVRATSVTKCDERFQVETTAGTFEAKNVVIATGTYQTPKIPACSKEIDPAIHQLHSDSYRNPGSLPAGAVFVAGTGQSGCQIAQELYQSGRKVYLSTGTTIRLPRRYRGKDMFRWLDMVHFFDQTVDQLESPRAKWEGNPTLSGRDGGQTLNLHRFARDGVTLLGRIKGAAGDKLFFEPNLYENLEKIDKPETQILKMVDGLITRAGLDAPPETLPEPLRDGYTVPLITELNMQERGISTIIWAIGFAFDYAWVHFPVFDADGYPIQTRGVTAVPGLYFLGMHWLHTRKSAILLGVGEDAEHLADQLI